MSLPACREPGCQVVPFMSEDWCPNHRPPYIGDILSTEDELRESLRLADAENEQTEPILDAAAMLLWELENVSDEIDELSEDAAFAEAPLWLRVQAAREKLMQAFGDAGRAWDATVNGPTEPTGGNER